jgi:hypothetical protein
LCCCFADVGYLSQLKQLTRLDVVSPHLNTQQLMRLTGLSKLIRLTTWGDLNWPLEAKFPALRHLEVRSLTFPR